MKTYLHSGIRFGLLIMVLLIVSGCGGSGAPKAEWEVKVTGDVSTPLNLSYQDLVNMDQVELNEVMMEKSTGEDEVTSWSGPALAEIFAQAGVGEYSSITALASDGYAIEISRDELEGAIIALKDHEGWIADTDPDKGPLRLVCPQTPGNRWVFQLTEIQVHE